MNQKSSDWNREFVADLFEVQLGKMLNHKATIGSDHQPYLGNFNVQWGRLDLVHVNTMHFSYKERKKFELQKNDLLVCEGGEVGRCAIWNEEITPCYYQKALHRLRPKSNTILTGYMLYYMQHIAGSKVLSDLTSQSSIAHLTREKLLGLPVLVPPLLEQQKIAQILSTWDRAIDTLEALIAAKQKRKAALMQQLLTGKRRLPGFGAPAANGKLPEEWLELRLGLVATLQRGFDLPQQKRIDGAYPIISSSGISGYHNEAKAGGPGVVTGRYGSIGYVFYVADDYWPLNTSLWVKDFHDNNRKFIYYLLCTVDFKILSDKTGVPGVNRNDAHRLIVKLPSLLEQQKIATVLSAADREIDTHQRQLDALKTQKKGLMQQLLTGKKRVVLDESDLPTAVEG
jgi:type I restriction enzyme S subunit